VRLILSHSPFCLRLSVCLSLSLCHRIKMQEREERVQFQLEQKKIQKKEELQNKRDEAARRIAEALEKHHQLHQEKKQLFHTHQQEAMKRAKELENLEKEKLKKQVEEREKKNRMRSVHHILLSLTLSPLPLSLSLCVCLLISPLLVSSRQQRLLDAFHHRTQHREEIVTRRLEKDEIYLKLQQERDEEYQQKKFMSSLKKADKQENVERVARINEFHRLQTMKAIHEADLRYEKIQQQKRELMKRHNDEAKFSLTRKHAINNAMDVMRVTNDYTLLDKLFNESKRGKGKKGGGGGGEKGGGVRGTGGFEGDDGDDPRLNQTI
jgi:uncharacterized membrane protein YgcG